ncbi:MAG: gliding motility protein GldN [Raineya sp.]|jgi:gliding motility associated protien GldN|nr:gliding motility protein GldN [Raineya sp.]
MKKCCLFLLFLVSFSVNAQFGYNPNAVRPVLEDDIMFRKTVVRRINLKEKQNKPFLAVGYEFPARLIQAARDGKVAAYDITTSMTDLFLNKKDLVKDTAWDKGFETVKLIDPNGQPYDQITPVLLKPDDIYVMELLEEVIFDKRRSRMYMNIIAINLIAPGFGEGGGDKEVASFKFKEVDRYFRQLYVESNQKEALWYNPNNNRRHMCVMDAFELRVFSSRILKVSNPDDKYLNQIYTDQIEELYKAQEAEMELMEFEHNLWEF